VCFEFAREIERWTVVELQKVRSLDQVAEPRFWLGDFDASTTGKLQTPVCEHGCRKVRCLYAAVISRRKIGCSALERCWMGWSFERRWDAGTGGVAAENGDELSV
jgi:hypothetical protein